VKIQSLYRRFAQNKDTLQRILIFYKTCDFAAKKRSNIT